MGAEARDRRAYAVIAAWYGDRRAARSGRPLVAHIDEGLDILDALGAAPVEQDAWCLHPMVQADADLAASWPRPDLWRGLDPRAVALAMAYRHTANAYLSPMPRPAQIPRSPLPAVARLLIADKVQNRKDFELYLRGDVPNSDRLDAYFADWLAALGVDDDRYLALAGRVERARGRSFTVIAGSDGRRWLARRSARG